ncbi:MAG: sigma-70 family RNA polymerase sigma factor [Cryobacterium sp.]|nr:sigma-70 family RNA polymerase sigma factor [Cryobacterium sp.]
MFEKLVLVPSLPDTDSGSVTNAGPSIDELVGRVAAGDQGAFSDLYDETSPRLFGLIKRILVDHAQSEEVAQEVFLEIWQTATRFDRSKGSAISWMLTMAHRRAIDRVRSAQSGRDRDVRIGIRDLGTEFDDTSEQVETRIESERVKVAMSSLSELQRQALTLTYYGGYTQSEVAEILSVPLGTVKTRLRDGMIKLRDELGVAS